MKKSQNIIKAFVAISYACKNQSIKKIYGQFNFSL